MLVRKLGMGRMAIPVAPLLSVIIVLCGLFISGQGAVAQSGTSGPTSFTVTTSTSWAPGETAVTLEQIPSFSASGTNCAALINNYFGGYIHDVHLILDRSFQVEAPLLTGDNTWLDIGSGVTITSANGENGPVVQNAHQTFVNLSGSANTVAPLVSATSPLFGDQNIMITGAGMTSSILDNNRDGQTFLGRPGYAYVVSGSGASAMIGTRCVFVADFSGVNNLVLSDFGMTNQTVFALTIGNCRRILRRNLKVFNRDFPDGSLFMGCRGSVG